MNKILITGGNGFLGQNLALKLKDRYKVSLCSRNNKNNEIAKQNTGCDVFPMDVVNINSVRDVVSEVKPNIIIHAAATKFVDLSEKFPMETVDVNVVGSQNICRVAIENNVDYVIGISTDKACPPIRNIYGMSKGMMEKMFCLMNEKSNTKFSCVRYGNVAWSTGSVLPVWEKMFLKHAKIGTTGPEMRRFFFTVDDAVDLVKKAIENKNSIAGKILSVKMKSAQIQDVLNAWIKKYGGTWEKINPRPGERIDEVLISESELPFCEEFVIDGKIHFLLSQNEKSKNQLQAPINSFNCERLSEDEILNILDSKPKI
jgi:UDP-N-acetylglucosamine 4,6-dehydratase